MEIRRAPPKISVVTPMLNCARQAARCIESVLAQDYPNFEHIVVDGGSTDGTQEVLRRFPHLLWRSETDGGAISALNKGLGRATGQVVTCLSGDDALARGALAAVAACFQDEQSFQILYGHSDRIDESGRVIEHLFRTFGISFPTVLRWWDGPTSPRPRALFYRREALAALGDFNPSLSASARYEHWIRAVRDQAPRFLDGVLDNVSDHQPRLSGPSAAAQAQGHWQVALSFLPSLSDNDRLGFWRAFCSHVVKGSWAGHDPPALSATDLAFFKQALAAVEAEASTRARVEPPRASPSPTQPAPEQPKLTTAVYNDGAPIPDRQFYTPLFSPWLGQGDFAGAFQAISRYTLCSPDRCYVLAKLVRQAAHLGGEIWECGVYKGGTAMLLASVLAQVPQPPALRLFDTFHGMPAPDTVRDVHHEGDFADTSLQSVAERIAYPRATFHQGILPQSFQGLEESRVAFAHVDVDLYDSALACCQFIQPRLQRGGFIIFDDYGFPSCPGAREAIDTFYRSRKEVPLVLSTGQAVVFNSF